MVYLTDYKNDFDFPIIHDESNKTAVYPTHEKNDTTADFVSA